VVDSERPIDKGEKVSILRHIHERAVPAPASQSLEIVLQTEEILAINKPAGLPTQDDVNGSNSLLSMVRDQVGGGGQRRPFYCHRLDKDVSGLIIMARGGSLTRRIMTKIQQRKVRKYYLARVMGNFPGEGAKVVSTKPLKWDNPNRKACVGGEKYALTRFFRLTYDAISDTSVVLCAPYTGRRHQLRMHLSDLGYPIANDTLYGGTLPATTIPIYVDDTDQTLRKMVRQEHRDWCRRCQWFADVLDGKQDNPNVETGIWLHSLRYEILDDPPVVMQTSLPPWTDGLNIQVPPFEDLVKQMADDVETYVPPGQDLIADEE